MIPQLLLEEINMGEKDARDYYKKYGREELEKALADLRKSDEEILAAYPLKDVQKEFVKKSLVAEPAKKTAGNKMRIWVLSAAAVFAVMFAVPGLLNTMTVSQNVSGTRVKGGNTIHHKIKLYKQEGDGAVVLKNGAQVFENDVIQITYTPGGYNYGLIFSVDGNGNITRHFPENSWTSKKLEKTGEEVPLSFAYALDNAPDYECFVFVASKEQFDMSDFESNAEKNRLSINYLKKGSYLPDGCDGSIFVLNKK